MPPKVDDGFKEKIFEKSNVKDMNKTIKKITDTLEDHFPELSSGVDFTNIESPNGSERIVTYNLGYCSRHYAEVCIKGTGRNYLEVEIKYFGDRCAIELKEKLRKKLKKYN